MKKKGSPKIYLASTAPEYIAEIPLLFADKENYYYDVLKKLGN